MSEEQVWFICKDCGRAYESLSEVFMHMLAFKAHTVKAYVNNHE